MKQENGISEQGFRALMKKYQLVFEGDGHTEPEFLKAGLNNLFKARYGIPPKNPKEAKELKQIAEYAAQALVPPQILREWQDEVINLMIDDGLRGTPTYSWLYEEPLYSSHPRWPEARQYITFWEDRKDWRDVRYGKFNYYDSIHRTIFNIRLK